MPLPIIILLIFILIIIATNVVIVPQASESVVERLGVYQHHMDRRRTCKNTLYRQDC